MRDARRPKGRPEVAAPSGGGARRALRGDVNPRPKGRPEVAAPSGGGARRALRGDVNPRPKGRPEVAAPSGGGAGRTLRGDVAARATIAGLVALALVEILWEAVLAPLRPGSAWLAIKALPLVWLVPGVARGARKPRQVLSLLLPLYAAEALVRAITEPGRHGVVAAVACAIAVATFVCLLAWFRTERRRSALGGRQVASGSARRPDDDADAGR